MKRIINLFLILLFPGSMLLAQTTAFQPGLYGSAGISAPIWSTQTIPSFSLQTGAEFGTFGDAHLLNTYLKSVFSKPLGKKFTLSAGAVVSNTSLMGVRQFHPDRNSERINANLITTTLFGSGTYQVNDRLTVSGAAYKTINPAFNSRMNPDNLRMEAQGVSFGVGYRISDNMHIGGEIRMQQHNSNFYNPFYSPLSPVSPFRNSFYGF